MLDFYYKLINPYLKKKVTTCSYCDFLAPLVILESKFMYITVAIGAYIKGYVQICSKYHRASAAELSKEEQGDCEKMIRILKQTFLAAYGTAGIAFEHGQAGSCMHDDCSQQLQNSLCHHMHIHCLPSDVDISDSISDLFPVNYKIKKFTDIQRISQTTLLSGGYLYFAPWFRGNVGYMFNPQGGNVPRQFLRKLVASSLGIPQKYDWSLYPGVEFFEETINELSPILVHYSNKFF